MLKLFVHLLCLLLFIFIYFIIYIHKKHTCRVIWFNGIPNIPPPHVGLGHVYKDPILGYGDLCNPGPLNSSRLKTNIDDFKYVYFCLLPCIEFSCRLWVPILILLRFSRVKTECPRVGRAARPIDGKTY